ncbi:MAG: hypothetical protein P4M11_10870 [Candidatus Pacebacteria bacterium]|nr:hypothetical protein [Candidatus Paceibacterota bacterium]
MDAIKYISISRVQDKKILVEHIPDKMNKNFSSEVTHILSSSSPSSRKSPPGSSPSRPAPTPPRSSL